MGRIKHRARKKRMIGLASISPAPFWAHIRKFGLKRVRTRRIIVNKEKSWKRGGKMKV